MNPFKDKFITNFHHADFDGAISGSCAKAAFGLNAVYKAMAIGKVTKEVEAIIDDVDIVLLTDIGIDSDSINNLKPYLNNNKLIIYDHHLNDKSKAIFASMNKSSLSVLDEEVCGATLTWLKLSEYFPNNQKLKDLEEIVYFSDVYDMWRIGNKDFEYAATLNDLLDYEIGYTPDQFRERWYNNPDPYNLSTKEHKIISVKKTRADRNMRELEDNAMLFEYKDLVIVITESKSPTDFTKMLFMNSVLEEEQIDMFIFKYPNTTQCSVRIPASSKIDDLNTLYEDFGCIGHAKAGGIQPHEFFRLQKILNSL